MITRISKLGRVILACCLFTFLTDQLNAQSENYKIDFKIKGFKDSVVYLGYYFWEGQYVADTAQVKDGSFTFSGKKTLAQGNYMLITKSSGGNIKLLDLLIGADQQFSIESSYDKIIDDIKVTGDVDNKIFFDHLKYFRDQSKEAQPFLAILQDSAADMQSKVEAREALKKVGTKVKAYQNDLIKKYPTAVTARIIKANQEIEIPEAPADADGKKDPAFGYLYYKAHYWDNFNLADEALLRLSNPLYKEKLKNYLDKMVIQNPDSIIKEIDRLAAVARKNKETYKYLVWRCITEYQQHPIMGMDAVFVHLSDKYLATGDMDFWMNEKAKKNFIEYAAQLRRSLIGQKATNLIMQDQNLQPRNMFDISKRYTFLFIFDPDCPHCREETPKLVNFYNKFHSKFDFEVYAVCSDSSMKKMKNFMFEMNTPWITVNGPRSYTGHFRDFYDAERMPSLYILDEKKKIIAKKPPIEELENFLTHYELAQNQKK